MGNSPALPGDPEINSTHGPDQHEARVSASFPIILLSCRFNGKYMLDYMCQDQHGGFSMAQVTIYLDQETERKMRADRTWLNEKGPCKS